MRLKVGVVGPLREVPEGHPEEGPLRINKTEGPVLEPPLHQACDLQVQSLLPRRVVFIYCTRYVAVKPAHMETHASMDIQKRSLRRIMIGPRNARRRLGNPLPRLVLPRRVGGNPTAMAATRTRRRRRKTKTKHKTLAEILLQTLIPRAIHLRSVRSTTRTIHLGLVRRILHCLACLRQCAIFHVLLFQQQMNPSEGVVVKLIKCMYLRPQEVSQ